MKILYISSLVIKKSSSASIRNTGLITGLISNGIEVDILTVEYPSEIEDDYLKKKLESIKMYKCKLKILNKYLKIKSKKMDITLYKTIFQNIKNILKNIYFFPDVDKEWINENNKMALDYQKYNLIITSSDTKTSHYIGEKIIKKNPQIKWYQIWGDPWEDDIGLHIINKLRAKWKEEKLLKKADRIFYVSPFTQLNMSKKYKQLSNKMEYLERGFLEEINSIKKAEEKIIISYTGVLNEKRNIFKFLKKINEFKKNFKQKIELNIYGNVSPKILEKMKEFEFINYKGTVSYEEIVSVYEYSDYLLFVDNGDENTTQIPGKIYDYLGTNKRIICIFKNKNDIYDYFKNKLKLLVYQEDKINISEIFNSSSRDVDRRFSNKEIAKKIINYYMENKI